MTERLELPDIEWERVSPKHVAAELVGGFIAIVIFVGATVPLHFLWGTWAWIATGVVGAFGLLQLALSVRRVRAIGYALREDDLLFRRGLLFQRIVAVPYGRMQLIDLNRGPIARWLGLSELKFVTAAAASAVTIPGIEKTRAEELRDRLVALAETRRAGL